MTWGDWVIGVGILSGVGVFGACVKAIHDGSRNEALGYMAGILPFVVGGGIASLARFDPAYIKSAADHAAKLALEQQNTMTALNLHESSKVLFLEHLQRNNPDVYELYMLLFNKTVPERFVRQVG